MKLHVAYDQNGLIMAQARGSVRHKLALAGAGVSELNATTEERYRGSAAMANRWRALA